MSAALLTVALVLVVALLTGAATALRSVSRIWLRHWAERRLAGAATAMPKRPSATKQASITRAMIRPSPVSAVISRQSGRLARSRIVTTRPTSSARNMPMSWDRRAATSRPRWECPQGHSRKFG